MITTSPALRRSRRSPQARLEPAQSASRNGWSWRAHSTGPLAALGAVLLWASFPPLGWAPLAWVATIPWLWLAMRPGSLPGWRPYLQLWIAGSLFWMAMLEGIRLPHPILYLGWIALSWYLGAYLPLWVAIVRNAARPRAPAWLIAPAAWVGLEWVRSWLIGCTLGQLAHSQFDWPTVIQVSDVAGGYGLSFLMILFAALLLGGLQSSGVAQRAAGLAGSFAVLILVAAYGQWSLNRWETRQQQNTPVNFLLIQGAKDVFYESDPQKLREILQELWGLTAEALTAHSDAQIVLWPESAYAAGGGDMLVDQWDHVQPLDAGDMSVDEYRLAVREHQARYASGLSTMWVSLQAMAGIVPPRATLILGADSMRLDAPHAAQGIERFNAALMVTPQGEIAQRYFKTHRVMFGEYIPVVDWLPALYALTPMPAGLTPGDGPVAFEANGLTMSPNICFESTVPFAIRGQLRELADNGQPAEVLVNLTNDGWFGGSAILDHHFACAVFRAVENRRPVLISANNGITAAVSGAGRVQEQLPRRTPGFISAAVFPLTQNSGYFYLGDWPAILALLLACTPLAVGRRQENSAVEPSQA